MIGFDMSTMNSTYFGEGLIDVQEAKEIVTNEFIIKDVDAQTATVKSLDFKTAFELKITEPTTIRAFLTHFDTFFSRDGKPTDREVDIAHFDADEYERSVSPTDAEISFTTGPRGQATHWKQVAFLIPSPINVEKGKHCSVPLAAPKTGSDRLRSN
jgi:protein arginine N-methyltransferase 3